MKCPLCHRENPPETQRCHCGHVFQQRKGEAPSEPYIEDGEKKPAISPAF